jgi:hypothetical protein
VARLQTVGGEHSADWHWTLTRYQDGCLGLVLLASNLDTWDWRANCGFRCNGFLTRLPLPWVLTPVPPLFRLIYRHRSFRNWAHCVWCDVSMSWNRDNNSWPLVFFFKWILRWSQFTTQKKVLFTLELTYQWLPNSSLSPWEWKFSNGLLLGLQIPKLLHYYTVLDISNSCFNLTTWQAKLIVHHFYQKNTWHIQPQMKN